MDKETLDKLKESEPGEVPVAVVEPAPEEAGPKPRPKPTEKDMAVKARKELEATSEMMTREQWEKLARMEMEEKYGPQPDPGDVMPEGLKNPPLGAQGHYCVDHYGRYRPTWFMLILHRKSEQEPTRQYVNAAGKKYGIPTEKWVDVPGDVVNVLQMAMQETTKLVWDEKNPTRHEPQIVTVGSFPRFNFTAIKSA